MSRRQKPLLFPTRAAAPAPAQAGHRPLLLAMALAAAFGSLQAQAQSTGAQAVVGTATLARQGSNLTVTTTNGANGFSAINWQSFNVPGGSTTRFVQPSAASTSINRVVGAEASLIYGTLSSNGRLVLVNPNGITVGAGAVVDTAAFTASTLKMSDADFLAGRLRFADPIGGLLRVDGEVLARSGDVVLIGQQVETGPQALVQSPQGATVLAAGQKVEVTGRGLEGIVFEVQAPADKAVNLGTLRGDAVGVFAGTLRHSGLVQAQAVTAEGGRVVLKAIDKATLSGGTVQAQAGGGKGGSVDVLGSRVEVADASGIDASGAGGGGRVRIGGDYQGANAAVPNAQEAFVSADSQVRANATSNGDGGRVIVWADDTTRAYGRIEAKAGPDGGNGGFIETSGKRLLDVNGISIDASAAKGAAGLWLLDPANISVVHGTAGSPGGNLINPLFDSQVTDGTLNAALATGTSVTVTTTNGNGTSPGDISFDGGASGPVQITYGGAGANSISFVADHDIKFASGSTTFSNGGGGLTVSLAHGAGRSTQVQGGAGLTINPGVSASTTSMAVDGGTLQVLGNLGASTLAVNTGMVFLDGGSTTVGTATVSNGTLQLSGGSLQATALQQTGGSVGAFSSASSLSVGSSFSSTGGTFAFHGNNLSIHQASGDLVIPTSADSIIAVGNVSLAADSGNITVNRVVQGRQDVAMDASGFLKFGTIYAGMANGGNVSLAGLSVGTTGGSNEIYANSDNSASGGPGGKVMVLSRGGDVAISRIQAYGGDAPGAAGGDVSITATGGNLTVGSIETQGSNDMAGGRAGNISLTAASGAVKFNALQAWADNGARGGDITITGKSVGRNTMLSSTVNTRGGGAFNGSVPPGNAGNISITATGGDVTVDEVTALTPSGPAGAGRGGNVVISASGNVTIDHVETGAGGGTGGSGGNVSITASGGALLFRDISTSAAAGGVNGNVVLSGKSVGATSTPNRITTRDGVEDGATGGNVTVTSTAGSISIDEIHAAGKGDTVGSPGADVSLGATGGGITVKTIETSGTGSGTLGNRGGNISLVATGAVKFDLLAAYAGGNGGDNASQVITVSGSSVGRNQAATNSINARGAGSPFGGPAGQGGQVRVTSTAGGIVVDQVTTASWPGNGGGSGGDVTLSATGGSLAVGVVETRAAEQGYGTSEGGHGGNVTMSSTQAVTLSQVRSGGVNGGAGGKVSITGASVSSASPAAPAQIDTSGLFAFDGPGYGSKGGDVSITATGGNISLGSITTQGGGAVLGNGSGGSVTLSAAGGQVSLDLIRTDGSQFSSNHSNAGNAGNVTVTTSGSAALGKVLLGAVSAQGSSGGGSGGNVVVTGVGDVTLDATRSPSAFSAVSTRSWEGVGPASSGNISITSTSGNVSVTGALESSGAGMSGASVGSITLSATTAGKDIAVQDVLAYASFPFTGGGYSTRGGDITATAGRDLKMGNVIASGAGGTGSGADGGTINLQSGGKVDLAQVQSFGGNGTGNGGKGGDVTISGAGNVTIGGANVSSTSVTASGGQGLAGGSGGNVSISSSGGSITVAGDVASSGGNATASRGGNGGTVRLTASGSAGASPISSGTIVTAGGAGPQGGRGGDVRVTTAGDIQVGTGPVSVLAQGGNGNTETGSGGNVSLASSGGKVKAAGVIQAFSGFATTQTSPTLGGAGGSVNVSGATSVQLGDITAWGSVGSQTRGRGGNVTVAANGGNLTVGAVDARGYITTTSTNQVLSSSGGGGGGTVSLSATGGALVAGDVNTYGGNGNIASQTTGSAGGNVTASATGSVQVGQVRAFGGQGQNGGGGGNAGNVSITSSGGSVTVGQLDAEGGGGSATGGNGGKVTLSGPGGVQAGNIWTYAGSGSLGGTAGNITIASSGGNITAGQLNTQSGYSYNGQAVAGGTVGITGGGLVSLQTISTQGSFETDQGSTAGSITVLTSGDISIGPGTTAISAGGGHGSLGSGGAGAVISLTSTGGNITAGSIYARGGQGVNGGTGGRFTASAPNGNVSLGFVDVGGGSGYYNTGATGGTGGDITVTAGKGVLLGSLLAEGGSGSYTPTVGGTGGKGGNVTVTVSQGNLDLSYALLSASGGTGGFSDHTGGNGGNGGKIVATATSGSVITSAPYDGDNGTEIYADGGSGGTSMGTSSLATDRGGNGGTAGSIVINSGTSAMLFGDMSAGGGEGGSASNSATAFAIGGNGGSGNSGSIAVNVTGAGQALTLGGTVYAGGGAPGLANWQNGASTNVPGRAGVGGTGMGTFTATAPGGVFIPSTPSTPITGTSFNPLEAGASLAIKANWTNNGALALHSGAWLVTGSPIVNNGAIELGFGSVVSLGSITFDSEAMPLFSPLSNTLINGSAGIVRGYGTIDGHLVNQGTVSPGMSFAPFGQITVTGHYNQASTGKLVIDAAPQGPYFPGSNHDQLRVLGAVTLGGSLVVNELVLPTSQVAAAGPAAQQLVSTDGSDLVVFLDTGTGITANTQFANVTAPTSLRSLLAVQNGTTLQTVDGLVVTAPVPAPSPVTSSPAPAPTAAAPEVDTSDAELVDAAIELIGGNTTREVVQEALTQTQATTATYVSTTKTSEKKEEKKETEVITTTTSCKPG